jgi:hypothetical protein
MAVSPAQLIQHFEDYVCPICRERIVPGGFTTWFRVKPKSAQALESAGAGVKADYISKIKNEILKNGWQMAWDTSGKKHPLNEFDPNNVYGNGPKTRDVCVGLFFGLSASCRDKDVDNMAKLFLDVIKGADGLISDDKAVTHLEIIKRELVSDPPTQGNYLVGVRISMVSSNIGRKVPFTWSASVPPII